MTICIPVEIKQEGGGYYFLQNFINYLNKHNIEHTKNIDDHYDVLFIPHFVVPFSVVLEGIIRNPGVTLVHRIDGSAHDYGRFDNADKVQKNINRFADLTIFQNDYCRFSTRVKFPIIKNDGPIINNPADLDTFSPEGSRLEFSGKINIACATWSTNPKKKAQDIYRIARDNQDLNFILCGRYPDAPDLINISKLGVLGRSELAGVFRSCDFFLHMAENDPCPNVVTEALASGLPVLYKDSGGTSELAGGCGRSVTIDSFRLSLDDMMKRRAELSRSARERAVKMYNPEILFARYLKEIDRIISSRNGRRICKRWLSASILLCITKIYSFLSQLLIKISGLIYKITSKLFRIIKIYNGRKNG